MILWPSYVLQLVLALPLLSTENSWIDKIHTGTQVGLYLQMSQMKHLLPATGKIQRGVKHQAVDTSVEFTSASTNSFLLTDVQDHTNTEWLRLEGISEGHLVHPPKPSRIT